MSAHKRQFSKEVFAPFSPRVSKRLLSKENQESNSISSPSITNQLIKECLKSDVTTDCWTYLLASESAQNFEKFSDKGYFCRSMTKRSFFGFATEIAGKILLQGLCCVSLVRKAFIKAAQKKDIPGPFQCNDCEI